MVVINVLTIEDIDREVNYSDLAFVESHLAHEVKRHGKAKFVEMYSAEVEDFKREWGSREYAFLLALLEYHDPSAVFDEEFRLEKYIVDLMDYYDLFESSEDDEDSRDLETIYNSALPMFRKRGILWEEIAEAV